jgi:hypothetical protein
MCVLTVQALWRLLAALRFRMTHLIMVAQQRVVWALAVATGAIRITNARWMRYVMVPTAVRLDLQFRFSVRPTPNVVTLSGAMLVFASLASAREDLLASMTVIVRTIKSAKMLFAFLVVTLLGFPTTKSHHQSFLRLSRSQTIATFWAE